MKKSIIAILLSTALTVSLAACSDSDNNETETGAETASVTAEETTKAASLSADGMFTLSDEYFERTEEESLYYNDECTLIQATYEILSLPDEAEYIYPELVATVEAVNENVRNYASDVVREYMDTADEDYEKDPEKFTGGQYYTYEYKYNPIYVSDSYVSLTVEDYCNMGGAHPSRSYFAYTIDIVTGEIAKIGNIVTDTTVLASAVADKLEEHYTEGLYNTKEELCELILLSLTGEADGESPLDIPWTVTENGISLMFAADVVAPYAEASYICEINSEDYPDLFK